MRKNTKKSKLSLNDINKLSLCMFLVKRELEQKVCNKLPEYNGVVLDVSRGKGVSRYSVFEAFGVGCSDISLIISQTRKEDAKNLIRKISTEFKFNIPGNGKGFVLDVEGYLGAKAPFVE